MPDAQRRASRLDSAGVSCRPTTRRQPRTRRGALRTRCHASECDARPLGSTQCLGSTPPSQSPTHIRRPTPLPRASGLAPLRNRCNDLQAAPHPAPGHPGLKAPRPEGTTAESSKTRRHSGSMVTILGRPDTGPTCRYARLVVRRHASGSSLATETRSTPPYAVMSQTQRRSRGAAQHTRFHAGPSSTPASRAKSSSKRGVLLHYP